MEWHEMKITGVHMDNYLWPRPKPIRNGKYVYTHAGLTVVRIETDEGITGIGLGGQAFDQSISQAAIRTFRPVLLGEDPFDVERIWDLLWKPKLVGRRGVTTRVISAIDIALWDIKGKATGKPLYKLLGGFRKKVPVYLAGGYYEDGKGLKELAEEMLSAVEMGARAVKMKIGGASTTEDVERVRTVRDAIGRDIKLLVDANNAYRYYEAIEIARKIEKYDIFWFEEPVAPDDYRGHALIASATSIPIATGENEYTRYGFRDLIEHKAAAIFNADAQILGGITEFMKVAALAQAYDLPIAPHGRQEVHVHLVASIPNGLILECSRGTMDPLWDNAFTEHLTIQAGCVEAPDRPGLGITVNEEALMPYRVH